MPRKAVEDPHAHRIDAIEKRVNKIERTQELLVTDIGEIKATQANAATKDDIVAVKAHMTQLINTVLQKALDQVPVRVLIAWTAAACIVTAALVLAGFNALR